MNDSPGTPWGRSAPWATPRASPLAGDGPLGDDLAAHHVRLAADVRARLGPACAHLSPDAFEVLVARVVAFKLRWDPEPPDAS